MKNADDNTCPAKMKVDLKELLHVIEDMRLKLVSEGRNKIKLEFENEMKEGEVACENDDIFVRADKDRIMQVMSNLLDNALKFTSQGVISIVVARRKGEEEMAVVYIQDTGSGIDPEIFPRLFTKFSSKSFSGTGLGLYISKNIIGAHGGKIWAHNDDKGKFGATFSFSLPLN